MEEYNLNAIHTNSILLTQDGEWEAPEIPNPECEKVGCGKWEAPTIKNKNYKGKWKAPKIDNPAYKGKYVQTKLL